MTTTARRPLGGTVFTVCAWLLVAVAVATALWHGINGHLTEAGIAVLAAPIFYLLATTDSDLTKAAWDFRNYLRQNHPWMYRTGVGTRVAAIGIAPLIFILDVFIFGTDQILLELLGVIVVLLLFSLCSVMISAGLNGILRPTTN